MDALITVFGQAHQALFEGLVQPLMFHLGFGHLLEDGYQATGWLLVGLLQIAVMASVFQALERWRPVEPLVDRQAVWVDRFYTAIHVLGVFRLALFFTLEPLVDALALRLRLAGLPTWQLDAVWPGVTDGAVVSILLYLVFFDLVGYAIHRAQHGSHLWWSLHSLHHSQRQMTLWSDHRNHLLDDLMRSAVIAVLGLAVGIAPAQFVAVVVCTQLVESLSHANLRLAFPGPLKWLLVSPAFHRLHHRVGLGHESQGPGTLGGHNFSVLFPVWDHLFGTARHDGHYEPTGVRDQFVVPGSTEPARDYGRGFWRQQWLGLQRLGQALRAG